MKVTAFLIKYGEIAIKGKNRYMFEDALMKQIRHAMAPVGDFKVRKESGRMFVEAQDEFDYDEAVEALQRVFGIVGICPMVIEENKDMEHLTETVIKFIDEQYPVKDFTFKVHARRGDKQFPLDSMAAKRLTQCVGLTFQSASPCTRNTDAMHRSAAFR